jgi:hypothetical protein
MIQAGGILDAYSPSALVAQNTVPTLGWWFWVKAGMGFTIGAGIVSVSFAIAWTVFWGSIFVGMLSHARF